MIKESTRTRRRAWRLAHRRLSIIDLSAAGHQPMSTPSGSVTLVFNGELYNFSTLRHELESLGWTFRSGATRRSC
jgi:asparagine synthase (glutamine-hydrolysing)